MIYGFGKILRNMNSKRDKCAGYVAHNSTVESLIPRHAWLCYYTPHTHMLTQASGKPYWRGRISTDGLLVLFSSDQLLIIQEKNIFFYKTNVEGNCIKLPLQANTPTSVHIYKNAYKHINLLTLFFANIKFSKLRMFLFIFKIWFPFLKMTSLHECPKAGLYPKIGLQELHRNIRLWWSCFQWQKL